MPPKRVRVHDSTDDINDFNKESKMKFNLKEWREKNGLTQEEASRELLISHDTISKIENGAKPRGMHLIEISCLYYDEHGGKGKFKDLIVKYRKAKK